MDKQTASEKDASKDRLLVCPNCDMPIIRVGCHAVCKHCGYQEGCGD